MSNRIRNIKRRIRNDRPKRCAYRDCGKFLPTPVAYGTVGISLSRADNKTLICSECGVREAMEPELLSSNFQARYARKGV